MTSTGTLLPLLVLTLLLQAAPAASAGATPGAPSVCHPYAWVHEVCVGETDGCTGVLFRIGMAGQQQRRCYGVHEDPPL